MSNQEVNQEVLKMLAELEEFFFYKKVGADGMDRETFSRMHDKIDSVLREWHLLTGCTH